MSSAHLWKKLEFFIKKNVLFHFWDEGKEEAVMGFYVVCNFYKLLAVLSYWKEKEGTVDCFGYILTWKLHYVYTTLLLLSIVWGCRSRSGHLWFSYCSRLPCLTCTRNTRLKGHTGWLLEWPSDASDEQVRKCRRRREVLGFWAEKSLHLIRVPSLTLYRLM